MKRIPQPSYSEVVPAVLHPEDLREIVALFAEATSTLTITLAQHEDVDLDRLDDLGVDSAKDLSIWADETRVALLTQRGGFQFYLKDDRDLAALGLRTLVVERLKRSLLPEAEPGRASRESFVFVLPFLLIATIVAFVFGESSPAVLAAILVAQIAGTFTGFGLLRGARRILNEGGTVYLRRPTKEPPWWSRPGGAIVVTTALGLVVGIVSAVAAGLILYFLFGIGRPPNP